MAFYFPFHIWDVILPIDELIFFKMVIAPPTRQVFLVACGWGYYGEITAMDGCRRMSEQYRPRACDFNGFA
jgi:hypothetical protein